MKFRTTLRLLLLAIVVSPAALAQQIELKAFEALELQSERGPAPTRLHIQAFGRGFGLELSQNTSLLASLPNRQRSRIPAEDLFLKGTLEGIPGSWVRLNRIDGRFSGGFFDGTELYLIDRADGFSDSRAAATPAGPTIVFRFSDLDSPVLIDHGGIKPGGDKKFQGERAAYRGFVEHLGEVATLQGTTMLALPLTIVSDVEFTSRHGGNTASVVAGRINFIDGIYAGQLGIGITLRHHEILSSNGTLTATGASDLLSQFQTFMRNGAGSEIPFEGVAHLFTRGRPEGGTAGIAFLGVLCNRSFGYGVDEDLNSDTVSALVLAHELGHNFNAPHDGQNACADETFSGIMAPSISSSRQTFSDCSLTEMGEEAASASCLVEPIDSQIVFEDGFEL